jgi:two-component system, OmpR family, response regulator CpxR
MASGVNSCADLKLQPSQKTPNKCILLIDDDVALCNLLKEYFGRVGFSVDAVHSGREGLEVVFAKNYDAVVLDLMLPGMRGLDVLQRIRIRSNLPVLILTAQGEEIDRILGLEVGADDYLAKPFSTRELAARLNAVLRRTGASTSDGHDTFELVKHTDLLVDAAARTVRRANSVLSLTTAEFDLLRVLLRHAGSVVTRDQLAQALGRVFSPMDRSIDLHISHLRRKLGPFPDGSERIKAVRGAGYMCAYPAGRTAF